VDRSPATKDLGNTRRGVLLFSNVHLNEETIRSRRLQMLGGGAPFFLNNFEDWDLCALLCKQLACRLTDTVAPSDEDCNFILKTCNVFSSALQEPRYSRRVGDIP
jgi:hypothetical protein